jgi:hypothetical protein
MVKVGHGLLPCDEASILWMTPAHDIKKPSGLVYICRDKHVVVDEAHKHALRVRQQMRKVRVLEVPVKEGAEKGGHDRALRNADDLLVVVVADLSEDARSYAHWAVQTDVPSRRSQ